MRDDTDSTGESARERVNRNWNEILQELRVIQAGTQIITGFLLAAALQARFEDLDPVALVIYLVLVGVAVLTTILGLTPVMLHRRLFRLGAKESLVRLGDAFATMTLVGVAVTLVGIVLLIVDLSLGLTAGIVAAGIAAVVIATLWGLLPGVTRRRALRGEVPQRPESPGV